MVLSYLPILCVLTRNLNLSAFPRNMMLPDPFLPNLKVDLLLKVALRILANYTSTLLQLHLMGDVYTYVRTRELRLLETVKDKRLLPSLLLMTDPFLPNLKVDLML